MWPLLVVKSVSIVHWPAEWWPVICWWCRMWCLHSYNAMPACQQHSTLLKVNISQLTRNLAIAGTRDTLCQLKSCQVLQSCTKKLHYILQRSHLHLCHNQNTHGLNFTSYIQLLMSPCCHICLFSVHLHSSSAGSKNEIFKNLIRFRYRIITESKLW